MTAIDLFSGAGGLSTGAKKAGVKVLWAANHCEIAVNVHARNHPEIIHSCQDLRQADWRETPKHDLLLASPCCQGHSKARGKEREYHDSSRATAWAVVDCVELRQPKFLLIENVTEFLKWRHYGRWKECLEQDYYLVENIIDAADLGVPQNRVRLFITGVHKRVSKYPITMITPKAPHQPAFNIIDWNQKGWNKIETPKRALKTLIRIKNGRERFGSKPFLIPYFGNAKNGRSLDRPLGTVTTKDRYALVDGNYMRMLTVTEYKRAQAFPDNYYLPEQHVTAVHLLGDAVSPPVARWIVSEIRNQFPPIN